MRGEPVAVGVQEMCGTGTTGGDVATWVTWTVEIKKLGTGKLIAIRGGERYKNR